MNILTVASPVWADPAQQSVRLLITFDGIAGTHSYLAVNGDAASQALFAACARGDHGPVGAYAAPTASAPQLHAYASAHADGLLATARNYDLGGVSVQSDATTATGTNLNALNVWAAANPTGSRVWIDNAGARTTLTAAQVQALAQAVMAYALSVYDPGLAGVGAAIDAGTITTYAAIDAASWPV